MDDILIGVLALVIGAAACFFGLRLWFALLPIWGFVAGFFLGATAVTAIFGDGFLSTVTGWVVGAVVGIGFGLLSYFIWYVGAIIAAASVGALAGSGLMRAFDVNTDWVIVIVAAIGAVLFAIAALLLALPVYLVVAETAAAGAVAVVTGVMLIFNSIDLDDLDYGAAWAMISDSWFWVLCWAVLMVVGIFFQLNAMARAVLPEDRWMRVEPSYPI
jgi:hypothetical protein